MENLTEEQKGRKASKRYFRVLKNILPPVTYMDRLRAAISEGEWIDQYRKFLARGEVDRKTFFNELYAHCTAEVCMREVILRSGSANEVFYQLVRLSTFTPEPIPFEFAMGHSRSMADRDSLSFFKVFCYLSCKKNSSRTNSETSLMIQDFFQSLRNIYDWGYTSCHQRNSS
jgi:hypothetical protein